MPHIPMKEKKCPLLNNNCIEEKCALWIDDDKSDTCVFRSSYFMLKEILQTQNLALHEKDV